MEPETIDGRTQDQTYVPKSQNKLWLRLFVGCLILGLLALAVIYLIVLDLNQPADEFPVNEAIVIQEGTSVRDITNDLAARNVVQSEALLYYYLVLFHDPTDIKASSYVFDRVLSTSEVATRLTEGDFDTDLISFTHFEGERVTSIAKRAAEVLPEFDPTAFVVAAEPYEGKLFPDTYFVPPDFTGGDLLELMLDTFSDKTYFLIEEIGENSLTLNEILVLASIIEREANTVESMKLVSSVLQNRIEIGMPLQADASIEYVLDKPLAELTPADLEIESPYNTYLNTGLPPSPIGNPGLDSILAVLRPTESDYFYYITGNDGEFRFSETYSEHLRNIELYLR